MLTTKTRAGGETRPGSGGREAWVHEKGVPRICPRSLADHLGGRMLLATDLSPTSRHVDARAIELAQAAGAQLLVLAITLPEATADASHRKRLAALMRRARRRGIHVEAEVVSGDPADAILRVATSSGADVVIIGDTQWRDWQNAGCVSGHVIRHSPCAVLIAHTPASA